LRGKRERELTKKLIKNIECIRKIKMLLGMLGSNRGGLDDSDKCFLQEQREGELTEGVNSVHKDLR
jgi:hypothetical protein